MYFVYILKCSDSSYYTGMTNNLEKRVLEHQKGIDSSSYTYFRRPIVLAYYEEFQNPNDAILWEKRIKGWLRKKKEALINKDWEEIKRLSNLKKYPSTSSG